VLGFDPVTSLYIAVALTFSSTIIIVKLLSDKREVDSLHGQIALGFLIVQDIVVVLAMIVLSAIGIGTQSERRGGRRAVFAAGGVMLVGVMLFIRFVATPLTETLARGQSCCCCSQWLRLPRSQRSANISDSAKELGGLLAGVSLASTPISGGACRPTGATAGLPAAVLLHRSGRQAAADPRRRRDLRRRHPFAVRPDRQSADRDGDHGSDGVPQAHRLPGRTDGGPDQRVLAHLHGHGRDARSRGLRGPRTRNGRGLITIAASTYMITYSHELYAVCEPLLSSFERQETPREAGPPEATKGRRYDVVVLGLGRYGEAIASRLRNGGERVLCVDFNPGAIRGWKRRGGDAIYGDVTDPELVATLPLAGASWVISAIADQETGVTHEDVRLTVIAAIRHTGFAGRIAIRSRRPADADRLLAAGADVVLEPFQDAADRAVDLLRSHALPQRLQGKDVDEQKDLGG
jgi:hypothetical protein